MHLLCAGWVWGPIQHHSVIKQEVPHTSIHTTTCFGVYQSIQGYTTYCIMSRPSMGRGSSWCFVPRRQLAARIVFFTRRIMGKGRVPLQLLHHVLLAVPTLKNMTLLLVTKGVRDFHALDELLLMHRTQTCKMLTLRRLQSGLLWSQRGYTPSVA